MRDVRRRRGGAVSWTTSGFSASTPTSGRSQPRTRGNGIGQPNKGAEIFMTKWIAAERAKAALRHAERDGKDQGEGSPKQASSYWFTHHL